MSVRLRQAVIAAAELEPVAETLRAELGLGEPFADPGVALFGLRNAVFPVGDCFVEVIAPAQPDTAVDRWLARHGGDGGYMLIFQVPDIAAARDRAERLGVRSVWGVDLEDIAATHLHPADVRGAIVSIDQPEPPSSWRWGGPEWTPGPGRLLGATVAVPDPAAAAERWGEILGEAPPGIGFVEGEDAVTEFRVALPGPARDVEVGGVRMRIEEER